MQGVAEAAAAVGEGVLRQTVTPPLSTEHIHIQASEDKLASDLAQVFNTEPLYSAPVTDQAGAVGSSQTDGQTSVKSLDEVMGEPNLRSTPVSSQERPGDIGQEPTRFDVQKVAEKRTPPALNMGSHGIDQHPDAGRHLKTTSLGDNADALDD